MFKKILIGAAVVLLLLVTLVRFKNRSLRGRTKDDRGSLAIENELASVFFSRTQVSRNPSLTYLSGNKRQILRSQLGHEPGGF